MDLSIFQGTKLWIIMEYLGGGSALDLVSCYELRSEDNLDLKCSFVCKAIMTVVTITARVKSLSILLDGAGSTRWNADRHHPKGNPERSWVSALWKENT